MATPSNRTPRSVHDPPDGISNSAHLTNRTHFLHTLLGNKTVVSTSSKLNVGLGYSQTKVSETNKDKCLPVPWSSHRSPWQRHCLGSSPAAGSPLACLPCPTWSTAQSVRCVQAQMPPALPAWAVCPDLSRAAHCTRLATGVRSWPAHWTPLWLQNPFPFTRDAGFAGGMRRFTNCLVTLSGRKV